jgi:hypothetical protein
MSILLVFKHVSKDVKSSSLLRRALLSVSPSVRMEQLGSRWISLHEILHEILNHELLLKSFEKNSSLVTIRRQYRAFYGKA